ncbi:MAG: DUF3786 domain-containing protein [Candidatus Adiutrix sp.]|jgi:hypothetical protein|nr:DUF3786 domain-containing protein [Candidatus Adiutrix sp.]
MAGFGGYEQIYQWQAAKLADCDLAGHASRLGLAMAGPDLVRVRFFGRDYLVDPGGVRPADGGPAGINHLSLVAHYTLSRGRGEPAYEFVPLGRLSGPVPGRSSPAGRDTFDREVVDRALARRFDHDPEGLAAAAARLEGRDRGRDPSGGRAWLFHPFPKVPLKLIHHEADEEFEAGYRLLFDTSATAFMEFEALGFLAGLFQREMCAEPAEDSWLQER